MALLLDSRPGWLLLLCCHCAAVAILVVLGSASLPRGVGPTVPPHVGFIIDPSS